MKRTRLRQMVYFARSLSLIPAFRASGCPPMQSETACKMQTGKSAKNETLAQRLRNLGLVHMQVTCEDYLASMYCSDLVYQLRIFRVSGPKSCMKHSDCKVGLRLHSPSLHSSCNPFKSSPSYMLPISYFFEIKSSSTRFPGF